MIGQILILLPETVAIAVVAVGTMIGAAGLAVYHGGKDIVSAVSEPAPKGPGDDTLGHLRSGEPPSNSERQDVP